MAVKVGFVFFVIAIIFKHRYLPNLPEMEKYE